MSAPFTLYSQYDEDFWYWVCIIRVRGFVCVRVLGLCVLVYKSVCVFGFIGKASCLKPFNTGTRCSSFVKREWHEN